MSKFLFVLVFLFHLVSSAENCHWKRLDQSGIWLREELLKSKMVECAEQEVIDPLLDPFRVQSFALQKCQQSEGCVDVIRNKIVEMTGLDRKNFQSASAVVLWSKMNEYAGMTRKAPLQLRDLPLSEDPKILFNELVQERMSQRDLNSVESYRVACSALMMVVGPGKVKAIFGAKNVLAASKVLTSKVFLSHDVDKLISKNRLPPSVKQKFLKWKESVEREGIQEIRKVPGFHDKPLKVDPQIRSVRLNDGYRVIYRAEKTGDQEVLQVMDIGLDLYPH